MLFGEEKDNSKAQIPEVSHGYDRRYFPRWEVRNRLLFRKNSEILFHESRTKDINCEGVCFTCQESLAPDDEVSLSIYLTDDIAIHLKGKTLWKKETQDGSIVGVHFKGITSQAQDLLLEYAFEKKKEDIRKHWFEGW